MQRLEERLPRIWRVEIPEARAAIAFATGPQTVMRCNGIELTVNEIAVLSPAVTIWNVLSGDCRMASMSLPVSELETLSIAIAGRNVIPHEGAHVTACSAESIDRLRRLHDAAILLAKTAPEMISNVEFATGLENALTEAMFQSLCDGDMQEETAGRRRQRTIIRRFRALAEEKSTEPLYLTEVCKAIGVPLRTLHQCCQEHLGMGPKHYLILRRMHLARRALRTAAMAETSVTEIATRFGFWELGRFAGCYRTLFGEAPSATLRRDPVA
jgi:AraC-like DNA-binding protein